MGSSRYGSITLIFIQLLAIASGLPELLQTQRTQRAAKLFIKKDDHHVSAFNSDINSFDTLAGIGLGKRDLSSSSSSLYDHYVPPVSSSDYAASMDLFKTSELLARLRL